MACVYHPDRETAAICSQCKADLCESCAFRLEDVRIICHRCMVALSLHDVRSEAAERKLAQEARRLGLHRRWRPTYIEVMVTVGALLTLTLAGLNLYWSRALPRRHIVLSVQDPLSLIYSVQEALEHYEAVHAGKYPVSLYNLLPRFLADTGENRRLLRYFSYRLDEREGYMLQIKQNAPFPGKELLATSRGVRVSGLVLPGEQQSSR